MIICDALFDRSIPGDVRIRLMRLIVEHGLAPDDMADGYMEIAKRAPRSPRIDEMGYFGNIWVRKLYFPDIDTHHDGHKHRHDHITQLATGAVRVEVDGYTPAVFIAPTFFVVKAEHEHKITALEPNTVAFCVFALRDQNGELTDHYTGDNSPYGQITE